MSTVLDEDMVYLGTKDLLLRENWILLAGQPPDGCDHLPVVEIKSPERSSKGSLKAYKPDLIAYKDGLFLIVECKPDENQDDIYKLRGILSDNARIDSLFFELNQRHIFQRRKITVDLSSFTDNLHGAIAHSGQPRQLMDLFVLHVSDDSFKSRIIKPTKILKLG